MMKKKISAKIYLGMITFFFYLPIIYIVIFSFNDSKSLSNFTGFSLRWYTKMLADKPMIDAIYTTIAIAIIATLVSTLIGTLASIGLSQSRKILRSVVLQINNLPILNPEIVTAIGLMLFYTSLHVEKGFMTMLFAHIAFCTPYVMLSIMPRIRKLDPNLADAAMDLGATPFYALRKVVIPQLMPGIIAGALIAFTMSFDDFIISYFVSGNGVHNISMIVYSMTKRVNPSINALSTIIILLITAILVTMNLISMRKKPKKKTNNIIIGIVTSCIVIAVFGLNILRQAPKSDVDPIALFGCDTINVFNSGEYIGETTVQDFEAKYNVKINYSIFASNEEMYTKLLGGEQYDVIIPSDYMIQRLREENLLRKLDYANIPNYKNVNPAILNKAYDPNNEYSVPYFWGSVGIIYNQEKVDKKDVETQGFHVLKNAKYKNKIYLYDSERDSFMIALKALGYSMNTTNTKQLEAAFDWLIDLKYKTNPIFVGDEVIDGMISGGKDIAVVYSGDATAIHAANKNMIYFEPQEGTNIWYDAMVVPKVSQCPSLAEAFINYNLEEEVAYNNSAYVGYTSSVTSVMETLSQSIYQGYTSYLPRIKYDKDEEFEYNAEIKRYLSELWIKIKAAK